MNESRNVSSSGVTGATEPGHEHFVVFLFCQISPLFPEIHRASLLNPCPPARKLRHRAWQDLAWKHGWNSPLPGFLEEPSEPEELTRGESDIWEGTESCQ